MLIFLTLLTELWAEPQIIDTQIIPTQIGATWVFPKYHQGTWYVAMGQQSDLWLAPMNKHTDDNWTIDMESIINLSQRGGLIDHSFQKCPDGRFIHVASTEIHSDNQFFVYDSDFTILDEGFLVQGEPLHAANDPSAICGEKIQAFGTAELLGERDYFWFFEDDIKREELFDSPRLTGAGIVEREDHFAVIGHDSEGGLSIQTYNFELLPLQRYVIPFAEQGIVNYWPSTIFELGDYILFISIGRNQQQNWPTDTGNLYLGILDIQYNLISWHQLTDFVPSDGGAMRPSMFYADRHLLIGFDRNNQLYLLDVDIDETSFGLQDIDILDIPLQDSADTSEDQTTSDGYLGVIETEKQGCHNRSRALFLFSILLYPIRRRRYL